MAEAAIGAVTIFLLLKYWANEGESEFSTAALAALALLLIELLVTLFLPGPLRLITLFAIATLLLKHMGMIPWWKASVIAACYIVAIVAFSLLFSH